MTRAAGFYNTLLEGDDPALVIEPLNGYRLKESLPDNIGEFRIPLGIPEILHTGYRYNAGYLWKLCQDRRVGHHAAEEIRDQC